MSGGDLGHRTAASPIAAPIWARNRRVVRARARTCAMASVNEDRWQNSSRQRQRVLAHRTTIRSKSLLMQQHAL